MKVLPLEFGPDCLGPDSQMPQKASDATFSLIRPRKALLPVRVLFLVSVVVLFVAFASVSPQYSA